MGIRLVVVDDNPHLSWEGAIHPANATFERFVAALLDVPGAPVASITTVVPIRDADAPPGSLPLDPRIQVVASLVGGGNFAGNTHGIIFVPVYQCDRRALLR